MGALTLTRENALVLVGCVVVWAVRRRWESALVFAAGLTLVLVPVAIRNYAVGGGLYLTTSQFGSNFYIGNNPRADGSYTSLRAGRGSPEYERFDATAMAEQATGRRLTPAEVSRYWTDRALAFIRDDPRAWLALTARKARLLWSANEMIDTESLESHAEHSQPLRVAAGIWNFGVLLPLAVVGGVVLWSQRRRLWILYLLPAAYAASVVLFFVVARYRYPMVPFVMIFAAAGATGLPAFVRAAPGSRVIATVIAAATLAVIAFWPQHTAEARRAITENNLGAALQEDGRVTEAVEHYRRALALDAHYTPALSNLGTALRAAGRVDDAIGVYEQALAQQPASASAHYNMANALMAQGRTDEAIVHFREAITADPRHLEAHHNLGRALETAGRIDEALAVFHRALALAPGNAGARYDLGSLMLERGSFSPAAEVLRDAIRIRPDYAEAHNNLGIALASQGAIDEAVRHWEEAVRLKPGFTDAQRNLQMARQTRQK